MKLKTKDGMQIFAFIILGLVIQSLPIQLTFGMRLPITFVAHFFILRYFPYRRAIVMSILLSAIYIGIDQDVFLHGLSVLHMIIIGFLYNRFKRDLFTWTIFYALIGYVVGGITLRYTIGDTDVEMLELINLMTYWITLLMSSLIVDLIAVYSPYLPYIRKYTRCSGPLKYGQLIFNGVIGVAVLPLVILTALTSNILEDEMIETFNERHTALAVLIEDHLVSLDDMERERLELGSAIDRARFTETIDQFIGEREAFVYLYLDEGAEEPFLQTTGSMRAPLFNKLLQGGYVNNLSDNKLLWLSGNSNDVRHWYHGYYIANHQIDQFYVQHVIRLSEPVINSISTLYRFQQLMMIVMFLSFLIAYLVEQLLTRQINQLNRQAKRIPVAMIEGTHVEEQPTRIVEFQSLSEDLTFVSKRLKRLFIELNHKNKQLHDKTKALEKSENELYYVAHHDQLTGLPNRRTFYQEVEKYLDQAAYPFVILFIDLNDFKQINDQFGHKTGDDLLVVIAKRFLTLQGLMPIQFFRLAGDEFVAIFEVTTKHTYEDMRKVLEQTINKSIDVSDKPLTITASIGAGFAPEDGDSLDQLLQKADHRMYHAKKKHREERDE